MEEKRERKKNDRQDLNGGECESEPDVWWRSAYDTECDSGSVSPRLSWSDRVFGGATRACAKECAPDEFICIVAEGKYKEVLPPRIVCQLRTFFPLFCFPLRTCTRRRCRVVYDFGFYEWSTTVCYENYVIV